MGKNNKKMIFEISISFLINHEIFILHQFRVRCTIVKFSIHTVSLPDPLWPAISHVHLATRMLHLHLGFLKGLRSAISCAEREKKEQRKRERKSLLQGPLGIDWFVVRQSESWGAIWSERRKKKREGSSALLPTAHQIHTATTKGETPNLGPILESKSNAEP